MPHATVNGQRLYYELSGHGDKTLVLFNGITMSTAAWTMMAPPLEAHYRLLRLDFLGQGLSDKPDADAYPLEQQAELAWQLLQQLSIAKVHLAGLSYGGMVAQYFAHRYPECLDRLLLASTLAWSDEVNARISDSWIAAEAAGGLDLRYDVSIPWFFSSRFLVSNAALLAELKMIAGMVDWPAVTRLIAGVKRHDARTWLAEIKVPTRVIVGNEDRLTPLYQSEILANSIPGASLHVLPAIGHVMHIEAPDVFAHEILRFCTP